MNKLQVKIRKNKSASREDLLELNQNELVERIIQLEAHNTQLKNVISKSLSNNVSVTRGGNKPKRNFDFSKCNFRKIFLRILYFGWNYQGLAVQEDSNQTIEHHLFHALTKCCLIESRETSNYHRCGRTDKGVSSFGQVISITLRSSFPLEQQFSEDNIRNEIAYCKILNRLLPNDIRVVCWMPIPDDRQDYSARFNCRKRQYKYYFPRSNLNVEAMRDACSHLIGSHDFRHLCKMDVGNGVVEFTREVFRADIVGVDGDSSEPTSMMCFLIEGNAFLWHQIRCIMGVLILIGQGMESPDILKELLDVNKNTRKPQYNMALGAPLNLFNCSYDIEDENQWIYDKDELRNVISQLQSDWTMESVKATMIKDSFETLQSKYTEMCASETEDAHDKARERDSIASHADCLLQGVKSKVYKPLLKRETCSTLDERIEFYKRKRKLLEVKEECK